MQDRSKALFQKMDSSLFAKVDQFKRSPTYGKIVQSLGSLSENQRRALNRVTALVFLTLPWVIVIMFYLGNRSLKHEMEMKKEIVSISNNILANRRELEEAGQMILAKDPLLERSDLANRLSTLAKIHNISSENIQISNFDSQKQGEGMQKTTSTVTFTKFSMPQTTNFLTALTEREKMHITSLTISKMPGTDLLSGTVSVVHNARLVGHQNAGEL